MKPVRLAPVLLLLSGCRAFDAALLEPLPVALPAACAALAPAVRLHRLRPAADSAAVHQDVQQLLARQLRAGRATSGDSAPGTAVLTVRPVRYGEGALYTYLSGLGFGVLNLLGFPLARYRGTVDVQLDIRNRRRELVGTYYAQGQARVALGLYRRTNYARADMARTVYLRCVRHGLLQLAPQLQADSAQLQEGLLE